MIAGNCYQVIVDSVQKRGEETPASLLVTINGLEPKSKEDRSRVFVNTCDTKLVIEMCVFNTKMYFICLAAHRMAQVPSNLWREDNLIVNHRPLIADEVNKTLRFELLVADVKWRSPYHSRLISGVKVAVKRVNKVCIGCQRK